MIISWTQRRSTGKQSVRTTSTNRRLLNCCRRQCSHIQHCVTIVSTDRVPQLLRLSGSEALIEKEMQNTIEVLLLNDDMRV